VTFFLPPTFFYFPIDTNLAGPSNTLKVGGTEAIKELLDHPAVNILMASIEGFTSAE
jgi:hypothetical protein